MCSSLGIIFPVTCRPHITLQSPQEGCFSLASTCYPFPFLQVGTESEGKEARAKSEPGDTGVELLGTVSQPTTPPTPHPPPQSWLYLLKLSRNHHRRELGPEAGGRLWPAAFLTQLIHLLGGEVLITGLLGGQAGGVPICFRVIAGSNADPGLAGG